MKSAFRLLCALAAFSFALGAPFDAQAQTASPTPDPFVTQLTSSPSILFTNVATDITGNGRFVVFESNGDVATERTAARNNADGNREIFLADYAQRRIFQITNTRNVPKPSPSPSPTPTPSPSPSPTASPSPTPTPLPTPADLTQVQIEISNNRPFITFAPPSSGGSRVFTIVFSSNAPDPGNFNGDDSSGALAADGNQEIWIYRLPPVADVSLSSGADLSLQDLTAGTFTRITDTPASRLPTPGASGIPPFVADDNRSAVISEDAGIIAFVSTRNLVPATGNADGNPELFLFNVPSSTFVQVTVTQDIFNNGTLVLSIFNENPSLSADGSVFAFVSNANLVGNNDDGNGRGNAEVYVANFSGTAVSNVRQVTRTRVTEGSALSVNLFAAGRRLSRDGAMLAFESLAGDPKANGTNEPFYAIFVYTIATDTFVQIGLRALLAPGDIPNRFPTFSDYIGLVPGSLLYASGLNFRPDGTFPPAAQDSEGLNPTRATQIFATQIPASSSNTFTRLTNHPGSALFASVRALASETRRRITYSLGGVEVGGGNPDSSTEVFYLLSPAVTSEASDALTLFTGASLMPVPTSTPVPSPTPTPTPTPSPSPGAAVGLAAGELAIIRASVDLAPSNATATGATEIGRRPALPIELNGVSVSVNGAAAGLYFVGNSPQQINFVVPIGLSPGPGTVVVNNNGRVFRFLVSIVVAQPDIFTSTNDAGGRAVVRNVTNPLLPTFEPFAVRSLDSSGTLVATVLEITLTGVRSAAPSEVRVTVGMTDITPALFVGPNREMPGFDVITFTLPESLAGAGDVPIIVTVSRAGAAFSSRPADSAPRITISP